MCLKGWWQVKGRAISLKNTEHTSRRIPALRSTDRCHHSMVLTSPAGGGEPVQERLKVLTSAHTIGMPLLNTLAFCLAVNNSCPRAVGGTCFRQEERMPTSKSLNIHCLLFAGTMCGSNCKLKWSCVHWHL